MSDSPSTLPSTAAPAADAPPTPTLIEVQIAPWSSSTFTAFIAIALICVGLIGIAGVIISVSSAGSAIACIGLLGVAVLFLVPGVFGYRRYKVMRAVDGWITDGGIRDRRFLDLARIIGVGNPRVASAHAADAIARAGGRGLTLRYFQGLHEPIARLQVAFEPCELNEVDPGFRGIALQPDELRSAPEPSGWLPRTARAMRLAGPAIAGMMGASVFVCVNLIVRAERITCGAIFWFAAAVALVIYVSNAVRNRGLMLVPSGLLRRVRHFGAADDLHLFRPAESVLITYPIDDQKAGWVISDGREAAGSLATPLEIRTLLRAWLSPVPPPTLEMVRELCGE